MVRYIGAQEIQDGKLPASQLMQMIYMTYNIQRSLQQLQHYLPKIAELGLPAERVFSLLESKSTIEPMPDEEKEVPLRRLVACFAQLYECPSPAYNCQ